jgi:hypothetical protein
MRVEHWSIACSVSLLAILLFAGCGYMLSPNHAKVELYAPKGVVAQYDNGNKVSIIRDSQNADKAFFYARGGDEEAVTFQYNNHIRRVELGKSVNPWIFLNFENEGFGFLVDDAANAWYTYEPFSIFSEPLSKYPDSETIRAPYREGWYYDFNRLHLLLTAGWGVGSGLQGEWGVGIGYHHALDLLYREISANNVTISPLLGSGGTSGITVANAVELRAYPIGGLFVDGGFAHVTISADTIHNPGTFVNFLAYPPWSASFNAILGGFGWAGDISYIELQYFHGLRDYRYFDLPPVRWDNVSVTYGLYLRL